MAYTPLVVDQGTPPTVRDFIRLHVDMQFHDVHCMFRLPMPQQDVGAGCNFAAANTLLSIVSGCSVTLYNQGSQPNKAGKFFKGVLQDFYPWSSEPPISAKRNEAIELLYYRFRNPLAHAFGIQERKQKGLVLAIGKGVHLETGIEALEGPLAAPADMGTITVTPGSKTLVVERLYWGVREMLRKLTTDKKRMAAAERYLKQVLA